MKMKLNGFSLVELIISIAIITMVIAGALFAFQIMQQNTSSGIAISKANEISEHIFDNIERDLKQTGIFYNIDTTSGYDETLVNPDNNYDPNLVYVVDETNDLNWTINICYDLNDQERVIILYEYIQENEYEDGALTRSKTNVGNGTCTDTTNSQEPVASALLAFLITKSDSKFTLDLSFPGAQDKTYDYKKIISVPQL